MPEDLKPDRVTMEATPEAMKAIGGGWGLACTDPEGGIWTSITEQEHLLIRRAAEVMEIPMLKFVKRAAIEYADELAHRHVDGGEGFSDD